MKILIRVVLGLVAVAAFVLSFASLEHLGELAGYGALSWLYPVVVDLGAVASCAEWLHARSRQALGMTWGLLGISVVLNGMVHWLVATGRTPSWVLITLVATVPPAVLGLVVHLAVGKPATASDTGPAGPVSANGPAGPFAERASNQAGALSGAVNEKVPGAGKHDSDQAEPGAAMGPGPTTGSAIVGTNPIVDQLLEQGVGRRKLAKELDITEHAARQLLASRNGAVR